MTVYIRQPSAGADRHEFTSFSDAILSNPDLGSIICWDDISELCCLDLDDIRGIDPTALTELIRPTPWYAWVSRSGAGIHAIFRPLEYYKADELAALATLYLRLRYPQLITFELLKSTFRPPGPYACHNPTVDTSELDRWLGRTVFDEESTAGWLEERGFHVGQRYPHRLCPIHPTESDARNPVIVYATGIYCHVCASRYSHGWFSFSRLSGGSRRGDLALMVRNKVHWDHARHVMRELTQLTDRLNERLYRAALVHVHGESVRDDRIFWPTRDLVRNARWWTTELGDPYNAKIDPILADLPICWYTDSKGKSKVRRDMVARLAQTIDLSSIGYHSLYPVHGHRVYGHFLERRRSEYTMIVNNEELRRMENEPYRPRYVEEPRRDVEHAWRVLEQPFPGINRAVIELLIAARGVSEGQVGLPPFVFLTGVTGAAKTASVMIAAAILGDTNTSIVWTADEARVRQGIHDGKRRGSFVSINEIVKQSRKSGTDPRAAMDEILNLTPDSTSHILYVGHVPLGTLPVLVWTDTEIPSEIRDSLQLARRLVHAHLPERVDWERSIYESGVHQIERLRVADLQYAEACNAIMSDVIDRFFTVPEEFRSIARKLGFQSMDQNSSGIPLSTFRQFFEAICDAPELSGSNRARWSGAGWKLVDISKTGTLENLWEVLRDEDNPKVSRACSEIPWSRVLETNHSITMETNVWGNKIVVRFRDGRGNFNRGCLDR